MMQWLEHEGFTAEFKKHRTADQGLAAVKKLLAVQFDPFGPKEAIAPAKIHRRHQNAVWNSGRSRPWLSVYTPVTGQEYGLLLAATPSPF